MFVTRRLAVAALVVAAVAAVAALAAGSSAIVIVVAGDGLLALAVAADAYAAVGPPSLSPARAAPDVVVLGEEAILTLALRNPTKRRLSVAVRDATPPSLARTPLIHRAVVPPHATARLDASIMPARRGVLALGPVTVRVEGPLGLAGRQATIPVTGAVKVYPRLPGRAHIAARLDRTRALLAGERSSVVRGRGGEFDALREYHPDDEFRRINWYATARAAKPISNVYREERNQQVLLLLDAGRMMAGTVEGVSRFEWAIDAAIAVAEVAARAGDHVGMAAFSATIAAMVPPRSGRAHPARVLDALFDLQPTLDAPGYAGVFAALLSRWRRRSLLVLITEITDVAAMEPLFRALPVLLRRHLVVVGAVRDPAVEAAAALLPSTSEEAYTKAAAAHALDQRERAAARLRAMGAGVVDRPAGDLAPALADQYLRAKGAGRL